MLRLMERLRVQPRRRRAVYEDIMRMSTPAVDYYIMVAVSVTIATYGLLLNSAAVVIGAMIVAPLMGPIFGVALGLAIGDRRLIWPAVESMVLGVALGVAVATVIGLTPYKLDLGTQILSRTQPTLFDMLVALASGLAGAYAIVDERLSPAMPGVAVAVALAPPLGVVGICLATARWSMAGGAFMLFLANFLAIQVASAAVFTLTGMVAVGEQEPGTSKGARAAGRFLERFGVSIAALMLVGWFMTQTLLGLVADQRLSRKLEDVLSQQVSSTTGASVDTVSYQRKAGQIDVVAAVLSPKAFEPAQVNDLQDALRQKVDRRVHLIVRSLVTKDASAQGPVYLSKSESDASALQLEQQGFLSRVSQVLSQELASVPGASLVDVQRSQTDGQTTVTVTARAPDAIAPDRVAQMQKAVGSAVGQPVRLIVESVLTRDADAHSFLYQAQKQPGGPSPEDVKLQERLREALSNQLRIAAPGTTLLEVRQTQQDGHLSVEAVARTPRVITPEDVAAIQATLRKTSIPRSIWWSARRSALRHLRRATSQVPRVPLRPQRPRPAPPGAASGASFAALRATRVGGMSAASRPPWPA